MPTTATIEQLLQEVFDGAREGLRDELDADEYERRRWEFSFHLMDCRKDLERVVQLLQNADQYDEQAASKLLIGCLYHVVPHLKAAARLLLDEIPDAFEPTGQSKE